MVINRQQMNWDPNRGRRIGIGGAMPRLDWFNLGSARTMRLLMIQKPSPRLRRALEEHGHHVDTTQNRAEADRKVRAGGCDLIVLDLGLVGIDALTLVRQWRDDGLHAPVLALAPDNAITDKAEALDAGADVLVTEPYDREELLAQIRALSRRVTPSQAVVQSVSDLEIDSSAPLVKRGGRTILLTRSEYDLLQFLVDNRGKVVSRSMIWEQVYGEAGEITSNVIDVCIHNLRNKIDKGFEHALILTHWGTGYMLREPQTDGAA